MSPEWNWRWRIDVTTTPDEDLESSKHELIAREDAPHHDVPYEIGALAITGIDLASEDYIDLVNIDGVWSVPPDPQEQSTQNFGEFGIEASAVGYGESADGFSGAEAGDGGGSSDGGGSDSGAAAAA